MSEERNDMTPRRRRFRNPDTNEAPAAGSGNGPVPAETAADMTGETAQTQGPYSRVPEEARRMSASPYGVANAAAVPQPSANHTAFKKQRTATNPIRKIHAETDRHAFQHPVRNSQTAPMSRVRVGYAPGRMNESRMSREPAGEPSRGREYPNSRYPAAVRSPYARPMPDAPRPVNPYPTQDAPRPQEAVQRKGTVLHILALLLIAAGVFLAVVLTLPQENDLRNRISSLADKATAGIRAMADTEPAATEPPEDAVLTETSPTADQFASTDDLDALLGNQSGSDPDPAEITADEPAGNTLPEETAGEAEKTTPDTPDETVSAGNDGPDETSGDEPEGQEGQEEQEEQDLEISAAALPNSQEGEDAPEQDGENPDSESSETESGDEPEEGEPEEEQAEPLTAEAVPAADPKLIKTVYVYSGKKQVKDYARPAKDRIHMPSGWDYTKQQIGVLTFRGNAFRTNGAVGEVENADTLTKAWEAESGSAKGSKTVYYGTGWPGQPAIVKWSTQIRQNSNFYEKFKNKSGLKEVIVAGLDGVIRFMNLETGELTRNGIKLGYPMRGTPSLHPSGYPYMSVGQFARKMKSGTGKIGLRQYNMYNENEITLINGIDQSQKPFNSTGSFETSALIDRTSDTEIIAGTNGLLYLIDLNSELDWQAGIYKSKQTMTVLKTKTSSEKNNQTAVESSPAMYDKYVYYADMAGILRCVDTDFLKTIWAVDTKDAVMASVALDMRDTESLDLYTANMLKNRKNGNAQIRRYNALTGKEMWCVEIGVKKDKKNNTDVGCKASPVIGENSLGGLVYFTVTGLSDDGRNMLDVGEATAALVALDKNTGKIAWAYGLSDRSESSPIAVYDKDGNGWIIQCAWDGSIVLLEGLSGDLVSTFKVEGHIEASPAAYNDIMVIGTTGKGTERIYGIRIGTPAESEDAE